MTRFRSLHAIAALLMLGLPVQAEPEHTIKVIKDTAPPRELSAAIGRLLGKSCIRLQTDGDTVMEVWLRAEVPVKATATQIKNGLTYREVPSSTVMGAVRLVKDTTDYRKQKIPAGVYTLRLAIQPVSDDHIGTAPYREFCLICPAAADKKPDLLEPQALQKLSARITEEHPAVLLLFPGKGATAAPKLVARPGGHQVLLVALPARADTHKATLLFGLVLVGLSAKAPESGSR